MLNSVKGMRVLTMCRGVGFVHAYDGAEKEGYGWLG